jgi:cell division protein ZapA (FtsZ GTPase activity inhibitor)
METKITDKHQKQLEIAESIREIAKSLNLKIQELRSYGGLLKLAKGSKPVIMVICDDEIEHFDFDIKIKA